MNNSISDEEIQNDLKNYPLGRYGKPEEVAWAAVYLLSDATKWMTGSLLTLDGGLTLRQMNLARIVNTFHTSNTYLIETGRNNWAVIDPGWSPQQLDDWISRQRPRIIAVMLTHEHADHCAGTNVLLEKYPVPLFCTVACINGIANSKHNFSAYIAEIPVFEIQKPVITAEDGQKIKLGEYDFTFVATPGHSPGGMCIIKGDCVFTGDTLLNHTKTPLNFPHSNKEDYAKSVEKLRKIIKPGMMIFPGHGEPFKI